MSKNSTVITLLVIFLLLVVAAIGVLAYGNFDSYDHKYDKKDKKGSSESGELVFVETGGVVEVPGSSNMVLVNDRFTGEIDKDALIVAIDSSGDAYVVQQGTVLVNDMVVSSSDESYSIQRLNDRRSSVSSN